MFDEQQNNSNDATKPTEEKTKPQDLNQGKEFPFKKISNDDGPKLTAETKDIFAETDKTNLDIERPLAQQQTKDHSSPLPKSSHSRSSLDGALQEQNKNSESKFLNNEPPKNDLPAVLEASNHKQEKGKSKKFLIILIVVLAVVLLAAASWWVYSQYFNGQDSQNNLEDLNSDDSLSDILQDLNDDTGSQDSEGDYVNDQPVSEEFEEFYKDSYYEEFEDADSDGLSDSEELSLGTNPARVDTDFDGLSDFDELNVYFTDPVNADSDGDGYLDGIEVDNGYNPLGQGFLQ